MNVLRNMPYKAGDMAYKPHTHPVVYYWIAHYDDGSQLAQYEPPDYKPKSIYEIQNDKLVKIGWYPITYDFAAKLNEHGTPAIANPFLPKVEVNITPPKRYILFMKNFISLERFRVCEACGHMFQATKFFGDEVWTSPICPKCGAHDYWVCKDCGKRYEKFTDTKNTPPEKGGSGHCSECGGYLELKQVTGRQYSRENRWRLYAVGYQETIGGRNYKVILYVDENGNVEVKYE